MSPFDEAVMESHNAVTAAFRKLAGSLRSAPSVTPKSPTISDFATEHGEPEGGAA